MLNVPNLRFPEFEGEWKRTSLKDISTVNPKSASLEESFVYIDLEAVEKGILKKQQTILRSEAPSRAQRVIMDGDILFQCVRPYQKNNYLHKGQNNDKTQWVASTGYAQIRTTESPSYLYHTLNTDGFNKKVMVRCTGSSYPAINSDDLSTIHFYFSPQKEEQRKISQLFDLLDERIATQNKIIEDLKKLKCAIIETVYNGKGHEYRIGDIIDHVSQRNKRCLVNTVLSVNNKLGFINQDEQFEDRTVASEDTSNYKVVFKDDFAYNPARINVGSIARLKSFDKGIVSPMYICFKVTDGIVPEYLESYFATNHFFKEMQKRLEGSVRLCLSFEGLCNIPILVPCIDEQTEIGKRIYQLENKIETECNILSLYEKQKQYLLRQMFI
ncbi:restriction endonuclease subunit S [Prevotella jejuni]